MKLFIMSEMLGNQYFLARKYTAACSELEAELKSNSSNYAVMKKLIICYLKTDQFPKAFENFYYLVKKDIKLITDTDPIRDDCPCPEIIGDISSGLIFSGEEEGNLKLGMLWLYCDADESLKYFKKISDKNFYSDQIKEIISIIKMNLQKIN